MEKEDKLKNVEFIKGFNKITLTGVCRELKIQKNDIYSMKAKADKIKLVKDTIIEKVNSLEDLYNERESSL